MGMTMTARCNSWIIVDRETGKPVMETWSPRVVANVRKANKADVYTALEWLQRFNASLRPDKPRGVGRMRWISA